MMMIPSQAALWGHGSAGGAGLAAWERELTPLEAEEE
jgi:hypothetical protein